MKLNTDTVTAILFIVIVLGVLAFTEWVILKDYEPEPATLFKGE